MRVLILGLSLAAASLAGIAGQTSADSVRVVVAKDGAAFEPTAKNAAPSARSVPAAGFTVSMLEAGDVSICRAIRENAAPDGFPTSQPSNLRAVFQPLARRECGEWG